jgi:hypothetical protein
VSLEEGALGIQLTPIPIDSVADAALSARNAAEQALGSQCDACDEPIEGEPAGHGLFLWSRGDEMRVEEPPLCGRCATAISVTALSAWSVEEEEG